MSHEIAYGFVIAYWRESGTLDFLWGTIYRKLRFSFMAALGALIGKLKARQPCVYLYIHLKDVLSGSWKDILDVEKAEDNPRLPSQDENLYLAWHIVRLKAH